MVEQSVEYRGKKIVYDIPDDNSYVGEVHLEIDGEHVHAIRMQDGNFGAHLLPYMYYTSIVDLAHDIMDKTPQFSGRIRNQKH